MKYNGLSYIAISCIINMTVPLAADTSAANDVTVMRDTFGTPHIYANNDHDLFYGYGYVVAEDRLYQLEMLRRSTQGMVAEVLGSQYAAFDKKQRTLFWPQDIKDQISNLDDNMKSLFKGYAAGINARIAEVNADAPTLMPYEFNINGFKPVTWTDYDVVMMFVGSMLLRFGDFNTELENQSLLADLAKAHGKDDAMKIFNAINPIKNNYGPTTIPKSDWQRASVNSTKQVDLAVTIDPNIAPHDPLTRGRSFSNALVLGPERVKGAKAILINGPQFGWYAPAYTYSVGFHTPTWNAVGNAPLGYPLPMFGYNEFITWGSTWAVMDNVDIFRETINPDNPTQYKHKGKWKSLRSRQEIIKVKDSDDITFTAMESIHGPIVHIDKAHNHAYAKRRGWAGRELSTLTGWIEATRAKDHSQWLKAVGKSALNVNWYFADHKGNIGYGSMGAYPIRAKGHDNRLPVSGEGHMDWTSIRPASQNPQILNPSSHYVANWNNQPAAGVQNPDEWWSSWSEADRVKIIDDAVKKEGKVTADEAWSLMMKTAFADPNAAYFRPYMIDALATGANDDPRYTAIKEALTSWDGTFEQMTGTGTANSAANGYAHTGNAIFRSWLSEMLATVLANDLNGAIGGIIAHATGYGTPESPTASGINISTGLKLLLEALKGRSEFDFFNGQDINALWLKSLNTSLNKLTTAYGTDMAKWHLEVPATRFKHVNFLNIPQALPSSARDDMPAMNRGTENNMTIFKADGVQGFEVVPPGQSGFINPQGEKAKHFNDQYLMYQNRQRKQTWLKKEDVKANSERTYTLKIKH